MKCSLYMGFARHFSGNDKKETIIKKLWKPIILEGQIRT